MAEILPNPSYPELWQALEGLKSVHTYAEGTPVFQQGRPAQGIYLVEKGEVRLTMPSSPQRTFEIAGPGTVLGLSETMTGEAHKLSAAAASQAEIAYVERGSLLEFLRAHHQFCLQMLPGRESMDRRVSVGNLPDLSFSDLPAGPHSSCDARRPLPQRRHVRTHLLCALGAGGCGRAHKSGPGRP